MTEISIKVVHDGEVIVDRNIELKEVTNEEGVKFLEIYENGKLQGKYNRKQTGTVLGAFTYINTIKEDLGKDLDRIFKEISVFMAIK